jgi:dihydrofolate reductase
LGSGDCAQGGHQIVFAVHRREPALITKRRNVIVHISTSADGYIARPDGDLEWLTSRPKPAGFYGMGAFTKSIDTKLIGRKTYEVSLRLGAKFDSKNPTIVFSRHSAPAMPEGVDFVNGTIGGRKSATRTARQGIWLMGGANHRLLSRRARDRRVRHL